MDCIFCKIGAGTIPSDAVFEDERVKIFRDIHPKAPVHLLVIPKMHIESVAHLQADHADVVSRLIFAAKEIARTQNLSGYKIILNVGREAGQVIDHLHLHILGGWSSDENPDQFRA